MYSLPSTSHSRAPLPFSKKRGTGALARNGLLTPPASDLRERSSNVRDRSHLPFTQFLLHSTARAAAQPIPAPPTPSEPRPGSGTVPRPTLPSASSQQYGRLLRDASGLS